MFGFSLKWKGKPAPPRETVTIQCHPVKCPCGTTWQAQPDLLSNRRENRCPDCGEVALPGRIGPLEPVTTTIDLKFETVLGRGRVVHPRR